MSMVLAIGAGGAIGAVLRYGVGLLVGKAADTGFPWGTLGVNVLGSFVMGALVTYMALHWNPSQEVRAFLTIGLLGGFTTFSTFSLDVVTLWDRGAIFEMAAYSVASLVLSIGALILGMILVKQIIV